MTPDELLDFQIRAAQAQVDLTKQTLDNYLGAAAVVASQQASAAISEVAKQIAQNPPS